MLQDGPVTKGLGPAVWPPGVRRGRTWGQVPACIRRCGRLGGPARGRQAGRQAGRRSLGVETAWLAGAGPGAWPPGAILLSKCVFWFTYRPHQHPSPPQSITSPCFALRGDDESWPTDVILRLVGPLEERVKPVPLGEGPVWKGCPALLGILLFPCG